MASLLSWAGNAVKRVANTVNNDVLHPVERAAGAVAAPVVNTAQVPYSAARLAAANVTGNQQAANNARRAVGSDANNNIFSPVKPLGNLVAGSLYARSGALDRNANQAANQAFHVGQIRYGNSPVANAYSGQLAGNAKQQIYGNELNQAHMTPNTSKAGLVLRTGGAIASAASPLLYVVGGGAGAATKGVVPALKVAGKFGAANAAATASGLAAQGAPAKAYVKPVLEAGALGAAAPLVGKAVKVAAPVVAKGAKTLTQENPAVTELLAKKQANIKAMDTAKPTMMKNLVANVNSLDSQIRAIKEGGYAKVPGKKPTDASMPQESRPQTPTPSGAMFPGRTTLENSSAQTTPPKTLSGSPAIPQPKLPALSGERNGLPTSGGKLPAIPKMQNSKLTAPQQGQAIKPLAPLANPLDNNTPVTADIQPLSPQQARVVGKQLTTVPQAPPMVKPPVGSQPLGLVKTVATSQQTTPKLSTAIQGSYDKLGNTQAMKAASERIAQDPNAAYHFAITTHSAEGNATAIQLAKQLEATNQHEAAANLMVQKAQQALQAGQGNQIYSLWNKLSPETVAQTAAKTIEKYNQTAKSPIPQLTAEQYQNFVAQAKHIQSLPEGSRAKGVATQNLLRDIGHLVPSKTSDKAFAIYRTGLLTGLRTPGKIIASHAISSGFEQAKNVPATLVDKAISLGTGKRSMSLTAKGNATGGWHGTLAAVDNLFTGYDKPGTGGFPHDFANSTHFSNTTHGKIAESYVNAISRLHGSLYKPFYGAQHLNSLYDMATTNAKNAGLKGAQRDTFIQDFVKKATDYSIKNTEADPHANFTTPEGAALRANAEAQYTTFQNKTGLSEMASRVKKGSGNPVRYVTPFTQIPSSIAMKLIDYSPIGPVKEAIQQVHAGNFDQRALSQAIGRGATGTGIMALGYTLYNKGMMTTAYPTDPKTQAQWKLEGKQANSILVGGKWRQLASLGPSGDALAVGGNFAEGMQGNKKTPGSVTNSLIQGGVGGLEVIANSPYLQGIQNISGALSSPGTKAQKLAEGLAGGAIPTGIANIATATDPLQRQTNSIKDAITNKIPGVRETNLPQVDALGNNIQRAQGVAGSLFDPLYSSTAKNNPIIQELNRTSTTPVPIKKSESFNGQSVNLSPQQAAQLNRDRGQTTQTLLGKTINFPGYTSLPLDQQQQMLNNIMSDSTAVAKAKYAAANQVGQYAPNYTGTQSPLTQKQQNILEGNFNPADYVPKEASAASTVRGKNGVKVKAPKVAKAKSTGTKAKGTRTAKAKTVSLATYLSAVKSGTGNKIKTPKAPNFKVASASGPKFRSVSLKQYRVRKSKIA